MRGHPVFATQHATACCCKGWLKQWHQILQGRALTMAEQAYIVVVIEKWLSQKI